MNFVTHRRGGFPGWAFSVFSWAVYSLQWVWDSFTDNFVGHLTLSSPGSALYSNLEKKTIQISLSVGILDFPRLVGRINVGHLSAAQVVRRIVTTTTKCPNVQCGRQAVTFIKSHGGGSKAKTDIAPEFLEITATAPRWVSLWHKAEAVCTSGIKGATICGWYIASGFTRQCAALKVWMSKLFSMHCTGEMPWRTIWCQKFDSDIMMGVWTMLVSPLQPLVYLVCVRLVIWWWRAVITPPSIFAMHASHTHTIFTLYDPVTYDFMFFYFLSMFMWMSSDVDVDVARY